MFLPEPILARLMAYAKRNDYSVAEVIRRAILRFLDDEEAKEKK